MNRLQPVEYSNQRILTTQQIAESFGTDAKHINDNFQNNKERYLTGKHYYCLEGDELKQFKEAYPEISGNLKYAPIAYLWTEKGTLMHAKSLNTDEAWNVYEELVDGYYRRGEELRTLKLQTARALVELAEEKAARIAELDSYTDSLLAIPHFEIDDGDRPTVARLIRRWLDLLRDAEEKLTQIKKTVKREVTDMKIDSLEHTLKQAFVQANRMKALIEINDALYEQTIPFFLQKQRTEEAIEEVSATIKALALPSDTKEVS